MNVSIIGAGRNKNGIGKYIARYFHHNGARVVSILGRREKSVGRAAEGLKNLDIRANPHTSFEQMLNHESVDAVVIASPSPTHYEYLIRAIDAGLHIFCEKPLIWPCSPGKSGQLDDVLFRIRKQKLTLAMNSQWPFSISSYEKLCGPLNREPLATFYMRLSPVCSGKEMLVDSMPHVLSMLYFVFGGASIGDIETDVNEERINLDFSYMASPGKCRVRVELVKERKQPRTLRYGFNGRIVQRRLDLEQYDIYFKYGDQTIKITDPLELSVKNFIFSVKNHQEPVIGPDHIKTTTQLLAELNEKIHSCRISRVDGKGINHQEIK